MMTVDAILLSEVLKPMVALIHPWVPFISSCRSGLELNMSAVDRRRLHNSSDGLGVSAAFIKRSFNLHVTSLHFRESVPRIDYLHDP